MMKRLASLDALRGFDMFWIMGGEGLACAVAAILGIDGFHAKFGHVDWHGLQFMDMVFPLFLFLAGVSFPFSAAKSAERGLSRGRVARKALRRGCILFLLGMAELLWTFDFAHFRVWSVLGRIGVAWMFAAWIYLYVRGIRTRIGIAFGLLALTTLVTMTVLAPGAPAGADPFSPEWNIGCWLDRTLLAGHTWKPMYDNEGFAGLVPAVVTAMLGMFAGEIVRKGGDEATGRKAAQLLAFGVGALALGLAWSFVFPINKKLWSPSFTLVVGGCSALLFALFYWLIDVRGRQKWSFFFRVIGMNSITIYLAQGYLDFGRCRDAIFKGLSTVLPPGWSELEMSIGYIAVCWLFLYFLYRKNTFLRV